MTDNPNITTALGDIRRDLGRLEGKLSKEDDGSGGGWDPVKYITAVAAMVTAVMAIYSGVLGWSKDRIAIDQAPASALKTELGNQKLQLEIEQLLAELDAQTVADIQSDPGGTETLINDIRAAVDALRQSSSEELVGILVMLGFFWVLFRGVGIAQATVQTFWQYVVFGVNQAMRLWLDRRKAYSRTMSILNTLVTVTVSQVPSLFFLYMRVLLFFGAVVPYFLSIAGLSPHGPAMSQALVLMLDYKPYEALSVVLNAMGG
ncbi:hypothetical protein [uncultured Tateyamaria sp.]|uniref:hypothetical protein n=1 Tax=uncultured Tateyamaria sp. TaxID=455651 RepID=UPI00261444BD|nr:hypothetical protein [uncultured Tateyamaria sp.]